MERRDFCIAASASLIAPGIAGAAGSTRSGADFSWLDARLAERVALGYFDGMSLLIGQGERVLHRAWFGNGGADAVLHVASTGKWTAAATIAALVDEGRLGWDDPVSKWLPEFDGDKGRASLRQLLSHTAGYPDYQPAERRRDDYPTLRESVAQIVGLPAAAAPGSEFRYGGLAMQVAGRMAELAADMPFDEIFQSRLARPLGMKRSGYAPVSTEPGFSPMLGGSLFTCAADYGRFLMMLSQYGRYAGRRVLSQQSVQTIEANQLDAARLQRGEYVEAARQELRRDIYGLGVWREETMADGAPGLLSSPGWAGAYSWLDRRAGLWGVVIAKANVERAVADGYSTFLGSSIYAPMARTALAESKQPALRRLRVPLRNGYLYCEESGKGEPVILLHGHALDRRQWQPQIAALESGYRVIRYDLRGYGRSAMPQQQQDTLHAEDLRALMDALGIRRAHLVGLSLGGFVLTDFIALHPERAISALVAGSDLLDLPGPAEPWTAAQRAQRQVEIAALKQGGLTQFKQRWLQQLVDGSDEASGLRQALWVMIDEWSAWQPLNLEPRMLLGRAAQGQLERSKPALPVLLLRGDREQLGWSISALLPQAQRAVIPDCGHVSNLEKPGPFNAIMLKWLAAQQGRSA